MPKNTQKQYRYTQNRELSWLRFDRRVLEEAADADVPALERLKFVSIFSSNLDEFFMVRVGSLFDLARMTPDDTDNKTGWTPAGQLRQIYRAIPGLLAMKKQIYTAVMDELARSGGQDILPEALGTDDLKQINRFFKTELLPVLSPIVIAPNHPVPHLVNKRLYTAALLESKKGHKAVGIVPVPDSAPPYLLLTDGKRFVCMENILLHRLPTLFDAYTVQESCILAVTRNADISFDDEKFEDNEEDFRRQMKKLLKQRDHLAVVRLELSAQVSPEFRRMLSALVRVQAHQVFTDTVPLNMRYVFRLIGELPKEASARLLYPPYHPRWADDLQHDQPMLTQIQQKDRLLFYPYDSVEPFLHLLNEAADDQHVLSIKIAIYRLASSSKIAQALCRAAENGKEVVQLIIRGICCILPGVTGETENIHVTSVVGRFLEHGRIYQFGRGDDAEYYISSADLMTRNLNRRVEIACPVHDMLLREQLKWILDSQLRDTAKASLLLPDGSYCRKHSAVPFDSQEYFMQQSPHIPAQPRREAPKLLQRLKALVKR